MTPSDGKAIAGAYPGTASSRARWVEALRPPRHTVDSRQPNGVLLEEEPGETGEIVSVLTVFLANRECPWRCVMCDLWKGTLPDRVPPGAIPAQLDTALAQASGGVRWVKLYNAGSFFDPGAVPPEDHAAVAGRVRPFERVVVECHPALVGDAATRFHDLLAGAALDVAMGLETAEERVLSRLNKGMTLDSFARAAAFLADHGLGLRVFVLVQPPFSRPEAAVPWAVRSAALAFDLGASVVSLIPTRGGNGAMEALASSGDFVAPSLATFERAASSALALGRGRVLADTWDLALLADCPDCAAARAVRLRCMNLTQAVPAPIACASCGGSG